MELGCVSKYVGRVRPKNMENPRTKRFLEEFKSTSCRLERPTAVIIPEKATRLQYNDITYTHTHTCVNMSPATHRTACKTFLPGSDLAMRRTEPWTSPLIPAQTWCQLRTGPPACCPPAHTFNNVNMSSSDCMFNFCRRQQMCPVLCWRTTYSTHFFCIICSVFPFMKNTILLWWFTAIFMGTTVKNL